MHKRPPMVPATWRSGLEMGTMTWRAAPGARAPGTQRSMRQGSRTRPGHAQAPAVVVVRSRRRERTAKPPARRTRPVAAFAGQH